MASNETILRPAIYSAATQREFIAW